MSASCNRQPWHRHLADPDIGWKANATLSGKAETLTSGDAFGCIDSVKWFAWILLAFLFATTNSCTTLVNRRDLYSPEPGPDSLEAARQWYGVTTTHTTATTTRTEEIVSPESVGRY